jgi:hypothetical protein
MSERVVIDYLRTRGRVESPPGFARSVMAAIDEAPPARSWFSAFLPAAAVAGVVAIIAMTVLLAQGPNVGPGPSRSPAPLPSAAGATLGELEAAVTAATERLAAGAVAGRHTSHIEQYLSSVTWFDWRPNGDHVVITREDIDVTAPWWADPEGEPLTVGERIDTRISVVVGSALYRSEDGEWVVEDAPRGPLTWGVGMLSGQLRAVSRASSNDDIRVTRRDLDDGGEVWTLAHDGALSSVEWRIGSDGVLDSYAVDGAEITIEGVDVTVAPDDGLPTATTRSVIEFTPVEDAQPILAPDIDGVPDPADFGLPADFPLATPPSTQLDYREYVEVALEALETYHWNAENVDWAAARSAALDGLPDEPAAGQAHQRIIAAIQTFDTFNTVFVRPGDVPPSGGADGPTELPAGDRIGEIALIALPTSTGSDPEALRAYLEAAAAEMAAADAQEPACGWIVDVREVSGGASGPLFSAVAGLLGEGRVITFDSAVSDWWVDVETSGMVSFGSEELRSEILDSPMFAAAAAADDQQRVAWEAVFASEPPHRPAAGDPPVVVLTSNATSSAGEQLVVAFQGRPLTRTIGGVTAGSPHSLIALRMTDGAQLRMPTAVPLDRDGTPYSGNVIPDDVAAVTGPGGDAAVDAAADWLEDQPGCS